MISDCSPTNFKFKRSYKLINISTIDVFVYRYPLETPVQTSFGTMLSRPMVIVKITDVDGIIGWGEIWCNFPNVGAEHRARLIDQLFAPLILSKNFKNAEHAFDYMTEKTWILGLQTGEKGPLAQCIAGLEIALCDIEGKQKNLPIWKLFGGTNDSVSTYASGINPNNPEVLVSESIALGYDSFKLKIGFNNDLDLRNLSAVRQIIGLNGTLLADANQAWSINEISKKLNMLEPFNLKWLEEPIAADRPLSEWKIVKKNATMAIAAGENIQGQSSFDEIIKNNVLDVIQPDLAKWGGLSKTIPLARQIIGSGKLYCPHYLGGGIGLVASAHALAAVGGNGMLEVDINPNPLRSEMVGDMFASTPAKATLGMNAGLGYEPNLAAIKNYQVIYH